MKLNKFELEKKMSLAEVRSIKAGSAGSTTSGNTSWSTGKDVEQGDTETDT